MHNNIKPSAIYMLNFLLAIATIYAINVKAELHPKIEESLNRSLPVDGFIFDIQSRNDKYYEDNLSYIKEQIDAIYDYSSIYRVIVLSRGREIESFLTVNYEKPVFKLFKSYQDRFDLKVIVDIEIAVSLGYHEDSFPSSIENSNNSYVTIISGKNENMVAIELERMSVEEKKQIKLSPTWRTDNID